MNISANKDYITQILLGILIAVLSIGTTILNIKLDNINREIRKIDLIREEQVVNTDRIISHQIEAERWKEMILENRSAIRELEKK